MEITLTPDQEAFIRRAIRSGRFNRAEDAVAEALLLWEAREVVRSELLANLGEARDAIANDKGRPITRTSMRKLAGEAKQRLRRRLAKEGREARTGPRINAKEPGQTPTVASQRLLRP